MVYTDFTFTSPSIPEIPSSSPWISSSSSTLYLETNYHNHFFDGINGIWTIVSFDFTSNSPTFICIAILFVWIERVLVDVLIRFLLFGCIRFFEKILHSAFRHCNYSVFLRPNENYLLIWFNFALPPNNKMFTVSVWCSWINVCHQFASNSIVCIILTQQHIQMCDVLKRKTSIFKCSVFFLSFSVFFESLEFRNKITDSF